MITNNSDNYDENYWKIKLNSGDDLLTNKNLEWHIMTIVVRSKFYEGSKYYVQVFFKINVCIIFV